jgi:hypothetical protein
LMINGANASKVDDFDLVRVTGVSCNGCTNLNTSIAGLCPFTG